MKYTCYFEYIIAIKRAHYWPCLCFCFFCATSRGTMGLLRALCSKITPNKLGEPYGILEIKPGSATCKALPAVILLQPLPTIFFCK